MLTSLEGVVALGGDVSVGETTCDFPTAVDGECLWSAVGDGDSCDELTSPPLLAL